MKRKIIDVERVKKMYADGMSQDAIAEELGITQYIVSHRLREAGVKTRPNTYRLNERKYGLNENVFKRLTADTCWVLGWLMGDGYTDGERLVTLRASEKDADILEKVRLFLSYEGPIYWNEQYLEKTDKTYRIGTLTVSSKRMVKDIAKFGIVPRKSQAEIYPDILLQKGNESFHRSFIRGMFESDGTVCLYKHPDQKDQSVFQIVGSGEMLQEIQNMLIIYVGIGRTKLYKQPSKNHFMLRYTGNKQVPRILNWVYKDAGECVLDRKYNKAKEIMNDN